MRIKLFITLLLLLSAVTISVHAITIISQWTFETTIPTGAGPLSPEIGAGSATATHASVVTAFSNPYGNGSNESWSANKWEKGDFWQFQVSTRGYSDIVVSFDQTSSDTGPGEFRFGYSTDLGATFSFGLQYTVSAGPPAWSQSTYRSQYTHAFDLSAVSGVENCSGVLFRIENASAKAANSSNPVTSSGTSRIDNFRVSGNRIPDSGSSAILFVIPLAGLFAIRGLSFRAV